MVTASDLLKEQNERKRRTEKTYRKIYKYVEKKIIECNNINLNKCYYEIPAFVLNLPFYSIDECKQYIIKKLQANEFNVTDMGGKVILVQW